MRLEFRVPKNNPLEEGIDYTLEGGRWVLTRSYLLKRGHCCGSLCRNCPYPKEEQAGAVQRKQNTGGSSR